jgi:arylsulfatase A-like enzyme
MRFPDRVRAGRSSGALVELVDLVPTVLEFCGAAVPNNLQGRSLVGLLEGKADTHRSRVFVEYSLNEEAMVRTERWKLIYTLGRSGTPGRVHDRPAALGTDSSALRPGKRPGRDHEPRPAAGAGRSGSPS